MVTENLIDIAKGVNVDYDKKIAVTSNDEIADLVIAFNKIQQREKEHIKEVEEQQAIIIEQERLASLGQLVGGIAHNLRTPIMSLSGAIEGLKDLVKEYSSSIGDEKVSNADHREIARDMMEWLGKMGPYCSYMSDIITAVKDQTVQHSGTEDLVFSVIELINRVELLMNNELKRNCCTLRTDCRVDSDTMVSGDMSILTQVLNNLITNAIQAYDKTGQEIEFIIQKNNNKIDFIIKDHGSGISKEIKDRLFKEMVTTKGKQGTGLGLFISHSSIKAHFKGDIWFESTVGKGTTFYVSVPIHSNRDGITELIDA
jgi:signal transduction histidine kinase